MRGKDEFSEDREENSGITPAYAGKSPSALVLISLAEDHPRICGEK